MPEAARKTDSVATGHGCDAVTSLDTPSGNSTVYIEGQLAARLGDLTVVHNIPEGIPCVPHVASIGGSSGSVYIAGALAARKGDACDAGSITSGSATVIIG